LVIIMSLVAWNHLDPKSEDAMRIGVVKEIKQAERRAALTAGAQDGRARV
jgi:hypothetical protein